MGEHSCALCDSGGDCLAVKEDGGAIAVCRECGLVYASPRPDRDSTPNIYAPTDDVAAARHHLDAEVEQRHHARHALRIIRAWGGSGSILEIGCGAGFFLDEARSAGLTPYGIELNAALASHARDNLSLPCSGAPLGFAGVPQASVDVVYHCDILSHLPDPVTEFRLMHNGLSDNGLLVFETFDLGPSSEDCLKRFDHLPRGNHFFYFSARGIADLLARTGFELLKAYRYAFVPRKTAEPAAAPKAVAQSQGFSSADTAIMEAPPTRRRGWLSRRLGGYLSYFRRYRLGRIAPKRGRPLTVIYVARRKAEG